MTVNELIKELQQLNGDVEIQLEKVIYSPTKPNGVTFIHNSIDSENPIDSNEGIYFIRTE